MQRVPECGSPGPRAPRPWIIALFIVPVVCGPAGADVVIRQRTVSESFPAFDETLVKKLEGRYGDGRTRIQLEAFSGTVQLLGCTETTEE